MRDAFIKELARRGYHPQFCIAKHALEAFDAAAGQTSPESSTLKPCPFCGSPGAICCLEDEPGSPASFWVNCSCGIETPERRTEPEAIALWNRRFEFAQWPKEPPAIGPNYTAGLWSRRNYAAMIEDFAAAVSSTTREGK